MTLHEELEQMFKARAASDPILSEALRVGPGGVVDAGDMTDPDSLQMFLNTLAQTDGVIINMIFRIADAIDDMPR